jgi:hypothetical protein
MTRAVHGRSICDPEANLWQTILCLRRLGAAPRWLAYEAALARTESASARFCGAAEQCRLLDAVNSAIIPR